ncbi:MAG TPA: c-type cytochrome, partial [Thermomicrobiales bacterium]|nr:c-type cytochrome [Thermomicrobiales bacterium]
AACMLIMRASRWLPVALIAAALVAIVLSGHATGANHPRAMISLAIVHVFLAIGWLGVVTWIASGKMLEDIRKRIEFSPLVLVGGVILLVGAGITMAIMFVPDQASLRATTYGTTLLVKIAIVLLAVGFGFTNWIVGRRWLVGEAVAAGFLRQVGWVLRGEVLVLAAAVCLGATLAETPPPARTALTAVASPLRVVAQSQSTDGLTIGLLGNLAGTTDDLLTIAVTDQSGSPAADVERVIVRTFNGQDEQRFDADPGGSGTWTFSPLRLPYPDMWAIDVTVRRSGVFDTVTSFSLDTRTWVAETPRVSERSWQPVTIPAGAFAFATLAIVVLLGGLMAVRRNSNVQPAIGAVIIIALVAIATGFAIQGVQRTSLRTPDHALALPAEDASIDATVTFQQFCLACHGANAQGIDATNPNHLHGSGTNLVDSGTRRLSDGDLYWLITHGVAGTDMPAYDLALSEAERWELVRHIRLVQKATPLVP